jgi:ribonuclease-3
LGVGRRLRRRIIKILQKIFSSRQIGEGVSDRLLQLERAIGYTFSDRTLLHDALKHRSYVYSRNGTGIDSNERLEFLGDAVLNLIVTYALYNRFPQKREGELTQIKSLIVSKTVLAQKAAEIDLGAYLLLSQEEEASGGRYRTSIVSDAYEALIGAIYLDGGLHPVEGFLHRFLIRDIDTLLRNADYLNFKSILLEYVQGEGKGQPEYTLHAEDGPDHQKTFIVEVKVHGRILGRGEGRSKKQAQQRAAREALRALGAF